MPGNIEQEITQLEKQLSEKKVSLGEEKSSEKEMLHDVVGERMRQHLPAQADASQNQPVPAKPQIDDVDQSSVQLELMEKVQELINLVFNKSLEDGIKEASKSNNPALIDAFHDTLVDKLYNMLLERKKLEQIKP